MKKMLTLLAGAVLACGAGVSALAWYTGTRLEQELPQAVAQAQDALQRQLPDYPLHLELTGLTRGVFTSTATFRLSLAPPQQAPVEVLRLVDRIEHGPFPTSRLGHLQLKPVMAVNAVRVERTPQTEAWFAAAGTQQPLALGVTLGYDQRVDAHLALAPLASDQPQGALAFSGLTAALTADAGWQRLALDLHADSFSLSAQGPEGWVKLELEKLAFTADNHQGSAGFWLGPGDLRLGRVAVALPAQPALQALDLQLGGDTQEQDGRLAGTLAARIGRLDVAGQTLGNAQLHAHYRALDAVAVQRLVTLVKSVPTGPDGEPLRPGAALESQLRQTLDTLLAAGPQLIVDDLQIATPSGSNHLRLDATLRPPGDYELPAAELTTRLLAKLDARLSLARGSLLDVVLLRAGADRAQPAMQQQARVAVEAIAQVLQGSGMLKAEGNDLVATLGYQGEQALLNGNPVPPERLAALLVGTASAPAP